MQILVSVGASWSCKKKNDESFALLALETEGKKKIVKPDYQELIIQG